MNLPSELRTLLGEFCSRNAEKWGVGKVGESSCLQSKKRSSLCERNSNTVTEKPKPQEAALGSEPQGHVSKDATSEVNHLDLTALAPDPKANPGGQTARYRPSQIPYPQNHRQNKCFYATKKIFLNNNKVLPPKAMS